MSFDIRLGYSDIAAGKWFFVSEIRDKFVHSHLVDQKGCPSNLIPIVFPEKALGDFGGCKYLRITHPHLNILPAAI